MAKFVGKKLKMTQVFKNGKAFGVTPILLNKVEDFSVFKEGEMVKVTGVSKGKGFAGGVKRHHFKGGPATHGAKNRWRGPGSIGSTAPQRVLPGRHMAGHMGFEKVTHRNIKLISVKPEEKIIMIGGAAPGPVGRRVEVRLMAAVAAKK